MNKLIMTPILTKDATIHQSEKGKVAHFRGAVKRPYYKEGETNSDYFGFVAFGKIAEFIERFGKKNTKFEVVGYLKNSNYEQDGEMVYKDDIVIQEIDFAERKSVSSSVSSNVSKSSTESDDDEFFNIDDEDDDDDTPFK